MNIIVCVKQVPDTETRIKLAADGKTVDYSGVKFVINPYDEFALEEAIKLKEKNGGGVTMVSIGPQRTEEAIRTGLAMGADNAIWLKEEVTEPIAVAKALAAIISKQPHDIIFCGKQAIDDDSATVCSALGEYLGIPNVNTITKFELSADKKSATVLRQIEGADEKVVTTLPAILSCQKGLNTPRYPTLPNIMKAKKKEIKTLKFEQAGLKKEDLAAHMSVVDYALPSPRTAGKMVEGQTPEEAAAKLCKLLHEEAKLI